MQVKSATICGNLEQSGQFVVDRIIRCRLRNGNVSFFVGEFIHTAGATRHHFVASDADVAVSWTLMVCLQRLNQTEPQFAKFENWSSRTEISFAVQPTNVVAMLTCDAIRDAILTCA